MPLDSLPNCENTIELLKARQAYKLGGKIYLTKQRIEEWYKYYNGKVYVSFSGGKDSTVLLHIVRSIYPEVPAVFIDTGLEYPEIKEFVNTISNVVIVRPKMPFFKVIEKYGYPLISKEQAQYIQQYRNAKSEKTKDTRLNGNKYGRGKISNKWKFLLDAPFKISEQCCDIMKKKPVKMYEKETGNHPILGIMAEESSKRLQDVVKFGCNAFSAKRPISRPLSFWLEKDIYEYLKTFNVPYSKIYDMGYTRTGCMFCMFGVHLEKSPNRFELMKETHPKQHDYCINKLGCGKCLDAINVKH